MTERHTVTAETRPAEPWTNPETGETWATFEPTGEFTCSCGVAWTQESGPPADHDYSRFAREGRTIK